MTDRSDGVVLTYIPDGRAARREVLEPRAGDGPDWERIEQARDESGQWHTVGRELVTTVIVEDERDDVR